MVKFTTIISVTLKTLSTVIIKITLLLFIPYKFVKLTLKMLYFQDFKGYNYSYYYQNLCFIM